MRPELCLSLCTGQAKCSWVNLPLSLTLLGLQELFSRAGSRALVSPGEFWGAPGGTQNPALWHWHCTTLARTCVSCKTLLPHLPVWGWGRRKRGGNLDGNGRPVPNLWWEWGLPWRRLLQIASSIPPPAARFPRATPDETELPHLFVYLFIYLVLRLLAAGAERWGSGMGRGVPHVPDRGRGCEGGQGGGAGSRGVSRRGGGGRRCGAAGEGCKEGSGVAEKGARGWKGIRGAVLG